jgi:putative IMPACT (imprinted ancient) family translation regulator
LLAELYDLSSAPLEREAVVFQWASALRERLVEPEEARRTLVKEEQERMDAVHARQMELEALALEEEKEQAVSLFDDAEGDAQHGSMTSWSQHSAAAAAAATSAPPIPIISGLPVTDRRSTFQAHAARVTSLADVATVLSQLRAIPKIARATHPAMYAAAIGGGGGDAGSSSSVVLRRCDDCGESGAGGRLEYLLLRMEVRDMIVVVTRWYGGIQLGGDRWKHINAVARDVVEKLREQQQAAETSSAAASGGSKKADKKAAAAANKAHKR